MAMRAFLFIIVLTTFCTKGVTQSKVYFTIGTNFSTNYLVEGFYRLGVGSRIFVTDNDYKTKKIGKYWNVDLTIETRLNKLLDGVTGLSQIQIGYQNSQDNFFSDLAITYLGIPLLLRANFVNSVHLDVGFMGLYPVIAMLDETRNQGTQFQLSARENIASQLTPFSLGGYIQATLLFNKFTLTFYLISGSTQVNEKFKDDWIIGNGSLFLRDLYPSFKYQMTGVKLGMRLL